MKKYDLIVIGGGAGGLTVAAGASSLGANVALIEKNEKPGGDCLHYGCIPSKALIEVAKEIHHAKNVEKFGIKAEGTVNMKEINKRVKQSVDHIQKHDDADRFRELGVDVYIGTGAFASKNEVVIDGNETIFGKRIVISTGSRPMVPPIAGLKEAGFLTNESVFSVEKLPKKMLVIGGGPIGIELSQAFSRLGSEVTVVELAPTLFLQEDEEIREKAHEILAKELNFKLHYGVEKVTILDGKKVVTIKDHDDNREEIAVDEILLATGRVPNSDKLDLEKAGVDKSQRGHITVNNKLQTSTPSIYAIGDVNGTLPFTHVAGMEGKVVIQNAVLGLRRKVNYSHVPWVIYTDPEVFHLGLTEEQAKEQKIEYNVFKILLDHVDRFVADHRMDGIVKIIADKRGYIIGAHAVGKGAGDFMQEVIFAKTYKRKIGDLSQVIHPYPNHASAVQRTADLYWRKKLFEGPLPKIIKKYIQWFR